MNFVFCVHHIDFLEKENVTDEPYAGLSVITFCPADYWKKNQCLPDYNFAEEIDVSLPTGYNWYTCTEETQWCSKKSKEQIVSELTALGFSESKEMEEFLSDCWS